MQEITYTVDYVAVWTGVLYGFGLAIAACFLMYLIGVPVEKIKSRKRGQRPLYVGFNVIATVLLVGLSAVGGVLTYVGSSLSNDTARGIVTSMVSKLHTTTETSDMSIQTVTVDKAVSSGAESGVGNFAVALSDIYGNTYRVNKFIDESIDKLDVLVVREVKIACTADTQCVAYTTETPDNEIVDSLVRSSITWGTVVDIKT